MLMKALFSASVKGSGASKNEIVKANKYNFFLIIF